MTLHSETQTTVQPLPEGTSSWPRGRSLLQGL